MSIRVVKWAVGGVMAAWSVLLVAWLTLHWAILPHIAQWRGTLERRATAALGVPVRIGDIVVRSSGWVPSFELRDVALLDPAGRTALKLPRVVAALSPRSLLSLRVRFEQLLVDAAELEIRRDADGRIRVAGFDTGGPGGDGSSAAADWFFSQREFVVRGGALRWVDDARGAPPLALTDVQLVVRNTLAGGHQLRIDATPPAGWGERFTLRGRFTQPLLAGRGDWRRWTGITYADLPRADLSRLRHHVGLPFELLQGDGAVRAWIDVRDGQPRDATVDLALRAVSLRWVPATPGGTGVPNGRSSSGTAAVGATTSGRSVAGAAAPSSVPAATPVGGAVAPMASASASASVHPAEIRSAADRPATPLAAIALRQVEGRLTVQLGRPPAPRPAGAAAATASATATTATTAAVDDDGGGSIVAQRFGFVTGDGVVWPRGDVALDWLPGDAGGGLKATRLDLRLLGDVAARLPLRPPAQALLADLRLDDVRSGVVTGLAARWRGALAAPTGYEVRGRVDGLELAARALPGPADAADNIGLPGVRNASAQWSATEKGGEATLAIDRGSVDFPGVFEQPRVPLDRASASIGWRIAAPPKAPASAPPNFTLQVKEARFANADAAGELRGRWSRRAGDAMAAAAVGTAGEGAGGGRTGRLGHLELDGRLSRGQAVRVARYLPLTIPAGVRRYVGQAVRGGSLASVGFRVKGDLAAFPFAQTGSGRDGEFRIAARVDDATFAYVPEPPAGVGAAARPASSGSTRSLLAAAAAAVPSLGRPAAAVSSAVASAALAPQPVNWPVLTALAGELVFDRTAMAIRDVRAKLAGVALSGVRGGIADLDHQPVLALDGGGSGALADMLRFVGDTPVGGLLDDVLAQATATGPAGLRLALRIPLDDASATAVRGSVTLLGNDVRLQADALPLAAARGRVDFTNNWIDGTEPSGRRFPDAAGYQSMPGRATRGSGASAVAARAPDGLGPGPGSGRPSNGFTVSGATARLLGGEVSFDGGSQADGSVRFSGSGNATADALRRSTELGALSRLAGSLSGQARYAATMAWTRGRSEMNLSSNLIGLAIDLPAPLRKAADTALPLHWQNTLAADPPRATIVHDAPARGAVPPPPAGGDTLRIQLGDVLQARFVRDLSGAQPRVLRGGIGVNEAAPSPPAGVAALLNVGQLDVDAWQAAAARLSGPAASPAGGGTAAAAATAAAALPADDYAPTSIGLRAQQLVWSGKRYASVVAGASLDAGNWRANVESDRLGGYLEYRPPRAIGGAGAGRLFARLRHLSLPKGDGGPVDRLLEAPTTSVPALDVTVDDLELRGKRLGRVEIDAVNRQDFGAGREAREWRLNRLTMTMPEARLVASGNWTALPAGGGAEAPVGSATAGGRRRAAIDFSLELADSGALLERLGMGRTVRGGKGLMTGQVAWLGSPMDIDYPSLSGQVNLAVDAGQFLKADPGAARLLGSLSLQSLPRRLQLDFRDVFEQGFAFDNLTGDLAIQRGVAQTANLRMRGVQATVLMDGSADLERETQNLRVVVVPEINAGAASLAYAAINPALGIGTFLAQLALRKPLMAAGTREFRITGDWSDPKVERVARRTPIDGVPADPAPLTMTPPTTGGATR